MKTSAPGQQSDQAGASPASGLPLQNAMFAYGEMTRSMVWPIESARVMFELNYSLLNICGEVMRRQQEALFLAVQRSLQWAPQQLPQWMSQEAPTPDRAAAGDVFTEFARINLAAFDRMVAAMRVTNDLPGGSQMDRPEPQPAEVRQGQGRPASAS